MPKTYFEWQEYSPTRYSRTHSFMPPPACTCSDESCLKSRPPGFPSHDARICLFGESGPTLAPTKVTRNCIQKANEFLRAPSNRLAVPLSGIAGIAGMAGVGGAAGTGGSGGISGNISGLSARGSVPWTNH